MNQLSGFFRRIALIVQIHLQQNRTDLAVKEVHSARKWAQDSLLVNLAEAWVGLRVVCRQSLDCSRMLSLSYETAFHY